MAQKMEARGGKGGKVWDDGADHDNITKIHVRGGHQGIQFIKFDYVKNGQPKNGPIHGLSGKGFTETFEINQKFEIDYVRSEYLKVVEGYYNEATGVVQGLRFKTNLNTSGLIGYDSGTMFSLGAPGRFIIGFHGFADSNLKSLGAYFTKFPLIKLPYRGGTSGGSEWDDGGHYDGVRMVYVSYDMHCVRHLKFDYAKGGKVETREHGNKGVQNQFVVNYPNDYITCVEATVERVIADFDAVVITSLTFKTSKGITSPTFGNRIGLKYVMQSQGRAITGFHGRIGLALDALGIYCGALPPSA